MVAAQEIQSLLVDLDIKRRQAGLELVKTADINMMEEVFKGMTIRSGKLKIPFCRLDKKFHYNDQVLEACFVGPDGKTGEQWRKKKKYRTKKELILGNSFTENCDGVTHVDFIWPFEKLESLRVNQCLRLLHVDGLSKLHSLHSFSADGCERLKNINGLAHTSALRGYVSFYKCAKLTQVDALAQHVGLTKIRFSHCTRLKSLDGLGTLAKLRELTLEGCSALVSIAALKTCSELEVLRLRGTNQTRRAIDGTVKEPLMSLRVANVLFSGGLLSYLPFVLWKRAW